MQTSSLAILLGRFPGRACVSIHEAAQVLGIAASTIYNQICLGRCDLPLRRIGGRSLVPLAALADFLDGEEEQNNSKRAGRPRLAVPGGGGQGDE